MQGLGLETSEDRFRCVSTACAPGCVPGVHGVCRQMWASECMHKCLCQCACTCLVQGRLLTPPSQEVSLGFVAPSRQGVPHCSGVWAGRDDAKPRSSRFPQKLWDP